MWKERTITVVGTMKVGTRKKKTKMEWANQSMLLTHQSLIEESKIIVYTNQKGNMKKKIHAYQ